MTGAFTLIFGLKRLLQSYFFSCVALQLASAFVVVPTRTTSPLASLSATTTATTTTTLIFDGPAWTSLRGDNHDTSGMAQAVVGYHQGQRVVGLASTNATLLLDDGVTRAHPQSIAPIPTRISDAQAAATLLSLVLPLHALWPRVESVGGGNEEASFAMEAPKIVVVGTSTSTDHVQALAALGANVVVVGKPPLQKNSRVTYLKDDTPFCTGKVDAILDTVSAEVPLPPVRQRLAELHSCTHVVSTVSAAAALVQAEGLIQGPGRVKEEHGRTATHAEYPTSSIVGLGDMAERVLRAGVVASPLREERLGWSWGGYWESVLWPRDTTGGIFGYPTATEEDDDEDEDELYDDDDEEDEPSATTATGLVGRLLQEQREQRQAQEEANGAIMSSSSPPSHPHVTPLTSKQDLQDHVVSSPTQDAVVLFAAPFCRTCRYLKPLYNRLASTTQHEASFFLVPDAASPGGKELSRLLGVDAVPAVVLFRQGRRWGRTLSISQLPDARLTQALEWMQAGDKWDSAVVEELAKKKRTRRRR